MIDKEVGKRIKYLREKNNYSRELFAEKIEISSKFLYEIEIGRKGFSVDILFRISMILNISCDYILMGKDKREISKELLNEIYDMPPLQKKYIQEILILLCRICSEDGENVDRLN